MEKKREHFFLMFSFIASIILMIGTVWAGLVFHSNAILLDAVLSVVDVAVTFAVIVVVKLLQSPPNKRFPFGYYKFEPLIVALEAGIVIAVCLQALIHTYKSIYHHEQIVSYDKGIVVMGIIFVFTLFTYIVLRMGHKKIRSGVMHIQSIAWYLDAWTNGVIWLGFVAGFIVAACNMVVLKPYLIWIDPLLTALIVLIVIREPLHIFIQSMRELVDASPSVEIFEQDVVDKAKEFAAIQGFHFEKIHARLRQAGRVVFAYLFYMPSEVHELEQIYAFHDALEGYFDHNKSLLPGKEIYFYAVLHKL